MVACERHRLSFETFDLVFGTNVIIYLTHTYKLFLSRFL